MSFALCPPFAVTRIVFEQAIKMPWDFDKQKDSHELSDIRWFGGGDKKKEEPKGWFGGGSDKKQKKSEEKAWWDPFPTQPVMQNTVTSMLNAVCERAEHTSFCVRKLF
jgi:hypothetical protein